MVVKDVLSAAPDQYLKWCVQRLDSSPTETKLFLTYCDRQVTLNDDYFPSSTIRHRVRIGIGLSE